MNILQLYDLAVSELKPVTVGGFSGASVWHVTDRDGNEYCLKKWPLNGPDAEHLRWIHGVIHAVNNSVEIPLSPPVVSNSGLTVVTDEGHCWDLTEWLPGEAPADDISAEQVQAALHALAVFHKSSQSIESSNGSSRSLGVRSRFAHWLGEGGFSQIANQVAGQPSYEVIIQGYRENAAWIEQVIHPLSNASYKRIPCFRDIWSDHVLFCDETVTGIIDYGAMRLDTPVIDIARLLGSYEAMTEGSWEVGITAYTAVLQLEDAERLMSEQLARINVVLSAMQWLDWLFVRKREFSDSAAVEQRVELLCSQIRRTLMS